MHIKHRYKYSKPGSRLAERFFLSLTVACAEWKWNGFASNDVAS